MTTFISDVPEIEFFGVTEPGVPNSERVVFRPKVELDIGQYAVIAGARGPLPGTLTPLRDNLFWFGSGLLKPTDWIFLYTGSGIPNAVPSLIDDGGRLLLFYWNRATTLFHDTNVVPAIWRISGQSIRPPPAALPQP